MADQRIGLRFRASCERARLAEGARDIHLLTSCAFKPERTGPRLCGAVFLLRDKLALVVGQCRVKLAQGERQCFLYTSSRKATFLSMCSCEINLRALVHAGDLRPGDRIPASRELATMLGVHRTTVANAYAELESEGLIQGHVGRGTFIKGNGNGLKLTPPPPAVLNGTNGIRWELLFADERSDEVLSRLTASAPENSLSFVMARPAQEYFPIDELQTCVAAVLKREGADVLNLGPVGWVSAVERGADRTADGARGLAVKDENLLITDGCQQSLDLISKAFVRPGDSVILENPTYPGAVAIFNGARARCLSVPVRTHPEPGTSLGIDVEALEATLAANRVKLIVLTPDFQNPTGTSMPLDSRRKVLELAARHQVPVVEDHIYARLAFARRACAIAEASGPVESGDSHRQLCEGGVSGIARGLDCGAGRGDRTTAGGEADDRSAHRSAGAGSAGGIFAARFVCQACREDAQGLYIAVGGAG